MCVMGKFELDRTRRFLGILRIHVPLNLRPVQPEHPKDMKLESWFTFIKAGPRSPTPPLGLKNSWSNISGTTLGSAPLLRCGASQFLPNSKVTSHTETERL